MFKMILNLLSFREILLNLAGISIKNYSDVQYGTNVIWLERDLNKDLW